MKKALFVLNPASGRQNFWNEVEGIIGCLVLNGIINQVDVAYTKQRYDARAATASLRYGQYDFIGRQSVVMERLMMWLMVLLKVEAVFR